MTLLLLILAAQTPQRSIAITIDDVPVVAISASSDWADVTRRLLQTLERNGVQAVGFVNEAKLYQAGSLDSSRVALLNAWLAAGHELGNHTYSHRSAHRTALPEYLDEIRRGEIVTESLYARSPSPASRRGGQGVRQGGQGVRYFRHPQLHTGRTLAYRDSVQRFLASHRYRVAPVTVDNQEWLYARAYLVAKERADTALEHRIVSDYLNHMEAALAYSESLSRQLFGREIPLVLLLHANELNADHLEGVLGLLRARGYTFTTLASALADSAYRSRDTYTKDYGPSWLVRWGETRGLTLPHEPREDAYISRIASTGRIDPF